MPAPGKHGTTQRVQAGFDCEKAVREVLRFKDIDREGMTVAAIAAAAQISDYMARETVRELVARGWAAVVKGDLPRFHRYFMRDPARPMRNHPPTEATCCEAGRDDAFPGDAASATPQARSRKREAARAAGPSILPPPPTVQIAPLKIAPRDLASRTAALEKYFMSAGRDGASVADAARHIRTTYVATWKVIQPLVNDGILKRIYPETYPVRYRHAERARS